MRRTRNTNMLKANYSSELVYTIISALVLILFYIATISNYNEVGKLWGVNFNLLIYTIILSIIYLVAFGMTCILKKNAIAYTRQKLNIAITVIFSLGILFYLFLLYVNEQNIFASSHWRFLRSYVNQYVYYLALISLFVAFLPGIVHSHSCDKKNRLGFAFLFAVLFGLMTYAPNYTKDVGGTIYHSHAYVNSIINVSNWMPYDDYNISIYGHYGLIMLPFVKMFGNNYRAIAITIGIFTALSYLLYFLAAEKWTKNTSVFYICIIAIGTLPTILYAAGQYYQVLPHRILFPSISTYLLSRKLTRNRQIEMSKRGGRKFRKHLTWEWLIAALAVVWNLETGLFCLIMFWIFDFFVSFQENAGYAGYFKRLVLSGIKVVAAMFVAWLLINGYNFIVGSKSLVSVKRFIYPLMDEEYAVDALRTSLPSIFSAYIVQIVIFSVSIWRPIIHRTLDHKEVSDESVFTACLSVLGIGALTYFINRTAYSNIGTSWIQMILVLAVLGDAGLSELSEEHFSSTRVTIRGCGKILMTFCIFCLCVECLLSAKDAIMERVNASWKTNEIEELYDDIGSYNIRGDTVGMGLGVPELLYSLHRSTNITITDWSDMNSKSRNRAMKMIESGKHSLLLDGDRAAIAMETGLYTIDKEWELGQVHYSYLLPIE